LRRYEPPAPNVGAKIGVIRHYGLVLKTTRRALALTALVLVAGFGGLAFVPGEVDPVAWTPATTMPLEGALAPNNRLQAAQPVARGELYGPEDIDVDSEGRFYAALEDGRIARVTADGAVEDWVNTGGRPLGMDFDPTGNLVVCDALKGLLSIAPDGTVTTLATEADGLAFGFADDVDVGSDGVIYFSDASWRWKYPNFMNDLFESKPYGRLLRYDPRQGEAEVLADSLYFANGVALSSDESFVLVNETFRGRISRVWLRGPKTGTRDVFAEGLPGYPDGVASDGRGKFYVAMGSITNPVGAFVAPRPWIRRLISRLPSALWPKPIRYGLVIIFNEAGEVVETLHDPDSETVFEVTSAQPSFKGLLLGNLHDDAFYVLPPAQ
jgi:sugar lactone lactonase YvrE